MSTTGENRFSSACACCIRRSWLLAELSPLLDYHGHDYGRLIELLALADQELLRALGGRRTADLEARYAQPASGRVTHVQGVDVLCHHDPRYPRALTAAWAPRMLHIAGGAQRLHELTTVPVVAIVGSVRATDYGVQTARSLARGLAASGVTVAGGLSDGIETAAQAGALELDAKTIIATGGGVDIAKPARRQLLHERVRHNGCVIAELPCGSPARRWGAAARTRILAGLATLTVVVEADEHPRELMVPHLARALGRPVAAVPGRVSSPASRGTHALLLEGARLVRGTADVLELLYEQGTDARVSVSEAQLELEPRLAVVLETVAAGRDTPGRMIGEHGDADELLMALSELELMGLLVRGDGGRYVPRDMPPISLQASDLRYGVRRQMES
jgi:DNA processing protein